ncbi:hypothetical protein M231_06897 [Tremella mesenterica]|uniref:Uncharacterized protein n=1 Tax=Tremella mesenterica TaxID=5217 RepID=A0A4Q1BAM3_TREME|nr:hypothetical protein M231_06897 [Tremella mesenterica]
MLFAQSISPNIAQHCAHLMKPSLGGNTERFSFGPQRNVEDGVEDEEDDLSTEVVFRWESGPNVDRIPTIEEENTASQQAVGQQTHSSLTASPEEAMPESPTMAAFQQLLDPALNSQRDQLHVQMRKRQEVVRQRMIARYGNDHTHFQYEVGDKVTLAVPAIDRPGASASRIPCLVCEVFSAPNEPKSYRLLCQAGVLDRLYRSKVLNPADHFEIPDAVHIAVLHWKREPVISLKGAARKLFATERTFIDLSDPGANASSLPKKKKQKSKKRRRKETPAKSCSSAEDEDTSITAPSIEHTPPIENDSDSSHVTDWPEHFSEYET